MNIWIVAIVGLGTALFTGLGALPFLFVGRMSPYWIGLSNALAGGFMIGASLGLFYESRRYSVSGTVIGAIAGIAFILLTRRLLSDERRPDREFGKIQGARADRALLVIGVMTLHSITEGVAVGVSFAGEDALGWLIALAIAVHNIPEGLAITLTIVPSGGSVAQGAKWSIFSSLPQPILAIPAYAFVQLSKPLLPYGLGFAGGAMVWMVVSELVPEAREHASSRAVGTAIVLSSALMLGLQILFGGQ